MSEVSGQSDHMDAPSRMSMICDPPNRSTISLITIHSILIIIHRLRFDSIHLGFFLLLLCSSLFHSLLLSPPPFTRVYYCHYYSSRMNRNQEEEETKSPPDSLLPSRVSFLSISLLSLFLCYVFVFGSIRGGGGGCLLNSLPRSSIPCLSFHLTLSLENSSRTEVEDDRSV